MGKKLRIYVFAKICHFIIDDITRNELLGVCRDVTRGTEVGGVLCRRKRWLTFKEIRTESGDF